MHVTTPEVLTVIAAVFVLLHVPGDASVKVIVPPTQICPPPGIGWIGATVGLTVITVTAFALPQLLLSVYDIIAVPAAVPVTTPAEPTVAMLGAPELHEPPVVPLSLRFVVAPTHTTPMPMIVPALGSGSTVTDTTDQPPVVVYDMNVVPAEIPVTTPVDPTAAMLVLLLLHVPPVLASLRFAVPPWQITVAPDISAGNTFTSIDAIHP